MADMRSGGSLSTRGSQRFMTEFGSLLIGADTSSAPSCLGRHQDDERRAAN